MVAGTRIPLKAACNCSFHFINDTYLPQPAHASSLVSSSHKSEGGGAAAARRSLQPLAASMQEQHQAQGACAEAVHQPPLYPRSLLSILDLADIPEVHAQHNDGLPELDLVIPLRAGMPESGQAPRCSTASGIALASNHNRSSITPPHARVSRLLMFGRNKNNAPWLTLGRSCRPLRGRKG